ncbi:glycosyltransferase [Paenibacillus fonticola]|uniref:glycosyltransferase n=1 Tax=Paenibacillus fonticola TaxID=379896 RepID=UPI000372130B|nr:glycosyltransferase [Paenibacillus fonticola]
MGHSVGIFAHLPDMQNYYMPNNGRKLEKAKVKDPIYEKIYGYYEREMRHVDPWIRWRDIERYCFEVAATAFGLQQYDLIHTQDIVSTRALWRVKPIVCSDAGGIPEMVLHGTTGMMSPAGNSEAMYSNLLHILQDDALRSRIDETARQWAIQRWSLRTMIDKKMDAYQSAVTQRSI